MHMLKYFSSSSKILGISLVNRENSYEESFNPLVVDSTQIWTSQILLDF